MKRDLQQLDQILKVMEADGEWIHTTAQVARLLPFGFTGNLTVMIENLMEAGYITRYSGPGEPLWRFYLSWKGHDRLDELRKMNRVDITRPET